jgi:hypothetical protein
LIKRFPGDNGGTGDAHTPVAQEYCKEHIEENGPQDLLVNDYDDEVESQEQFHSPHMDHG